MRSQANRSALTLIHEIRRKTLASQCARALAEWREYLELDPTAADAEQARVRIAALERNSSTGNQPPR